MSGLCSRGCVGYVTLGACLCVGTSLCVFLPAGKITLQVAFGFVNKQKNHSEVWTLSSGEHHSSSPHTKTKSDRHEQTLSHPVGPSDVPASLTRLRTVHRLYEEAKPSLGLTGRRLEGGFGIWRLRRVSLCNGATASDSSRTVVIIVARGHLVLQLVS